MSHPTLFWVYLGLAVLGTVLPYSQLLPWLMAHGLDLGDFFRELFSTRVGAFFGWDVIVSAVVVTLFVLIDGRGGQVPHLWLPIAALLLVCVSSGLPLFLALRERELETGSA